VGVFEGWESVGWVVGGGVGCEVLRGGGGWGGVGLGRGGNGAMAHFEVEEG